jgi:DNA invertase Pin-like site-specific DNA recombinase
MGKRKCALYGRVSTQRQAAVEDGGFDTQFNLIERFVEFESEKEQDAKWIVACNYREEGKSGKNLERPEFKRMMADIEAGKVNTVIVLKIDRITRSFRDFYTLTIDVNQELDDPSSGHMNILLFEE